MKLLVEVNFEIDGRPPIEAEKQHIAEQVITGWPTWVFTYGDEGDEGALIANLTCEWQ